MRPIDIRLDTPQGAQAGLWRAAQALGMVLTAALLLGLVLTPAPSLNLLWNVAIPVLPAVFLVNPMLWRNVCPLATANMTTGNRWGRRVVPASALHWTSAVGIGLLFLLVPARRFLFNEHGPALAITVAGVALLAGTAGVFFYGKSGFCNAVCPVLSVERLYGQRPLVETSNARCVSCTLCTQRGCIDLTTNKSIPQTLGPDRRSHRWLWTPFGAFAASFPGFVLGYFTTANGPLSTAGSVYLHVLGFSAASLALTALASWVFNMKSSTAVLILAGAAIAIYYWFAVPGLVTGLGLPGQTSLPLHALAFALIGLWFWRAFYPGSARPTPLVMAAKPPPRE